ncbi:MAG: DUF3025 domain-containing protein [Dokdonella sp.]|nr:DUF3025 domain-containing protein [Dokdonella sp.]
MPHPLLRIWQSAAGPSRADAFSVAELERLRLAAVEADRIERPRFRAQDAALLADGLHYETRIAGRGELATRECDPHDFYNALVWLRHPRLKRALNARQVADIASVGPKRRTRGQCALTHFDEAGAIVWLAEPALLPSWDAHDWSALFGAQRAQWGCSIAVTVFGHALVEHVWNGHDLPVAKALAVRVSSRGFASLNIEAGVMIARWPAAEERIAAAIAAGELLADPQELRPLPLAGIPDWHAANTQPTFLREAPCFRPLRAGRRYPPPYECGDGF